MAWNKFIVAGLVASVGIVGCTVTTTSDNGGKDGGGTGAGAGDSAAGKTGSGGKTSTGGSTSAGGSSAGGSSAGGSSSGGSSSGGATGGDAAVDAGPDSGCTVCLKAKCATEWTDCAADPDKACGPSGTYDGEFVSTQLCMFAAAGDSSAPAFTEQNLIDCSVGKGGSAVQSAATQALITCARGLADASVQPCTTECFGGEVH